MLLLLFARRMHLKCKAWPEKTVKADGNWWVLKNTSAPLLRKIGMWCHQSSWKWSLVYHVSWGDLFANFFREKRSSRSFPFLVTVSWAARAISLTNDNPVQSASSRASHFSVPLLPTACVRPLFPARTPTVTLLLLLSSSSSPFAQLPGIWSCSIISWTYSISSHCQKKNAWISYHVLQCPELPISTSSILSLTFPALKFVLETAWNSAHITLFIVFSLLTMPHPHFLPENPLHAPMGYLSMGISLHGHLCQAAFGITQGQIVAFSLCCFLGLSLPFISHCFYPFEVWTVRYLNGESCILWIFSHLTSFILGSW